MKTILFIIATIAVWIHLTDPKGGYVQNPNMERTDCPFGMSWNDTAGCEIQAPGWFCHEGTPDGWSICDSGGIVPMPFNQHGDFRPATEGIGFFAWHLNYSWDKEYIGNKLLKPLPRGCYKARIRIKPSIKSNRVASFWFIAGQDSHKVQPQPNSNWQNIVIRGQSPVPIDSIFIGGYARSQLNKPGWLASSYYIISFVGLWRDNCDRPLHLNNFGDTVRGGIR